MNDKYITVTQLTRYIKHKIDQDVNLNQVFLKGEISNFKAHTRGHFYFTLKDENSRINAIMFHSNASKLPFLPEEGMKVLVTGKISVYEATGGYQIYVNEMLEDGVGNLYVAFEQLKKKLEQEGLFASEHKRKIPRIPNTVGIVTAPTGAAIKDILSTIKRRWPLAKTILFPSLVQGIEAKEDVARQIRRAQEYPLDVLIVGRGGGSIEDLWCFNEEIVARAIYDSKIPVISAVGHEVDFTISDFVADLRAPTPTGAAEMAVPNRMDVYNYCEQLKIRANKIMEKQLDINKQKLEQILNRYVLKNPISIYQIKEQDFDRLLDKLQNNILKIIDKNQDRLTYLTNSYALKNPEQLYLNKYQQYKILYDRLITNQKNTLEKREHLYLQLIGKLETLNPLLTLKRGYSIIRKENKIVPSIKDLKAKDIIQVELKDGKIKAEVL